MKFGFRMPSFKKRLSARLSWKRYLRHGLGLKMPRGLDMLTNPKKALYNKLYNKTTFGLNDVGKLLNTKKTNPTPSPIQPMKIEPAEQNMGTIIRSSSKALTVTSGNFLDLRKQITDIYTQRAELTKKLRSAKFKFYRLSAIHFLSFIIIVGFFYKKIAEKRKAQQNLVQELEKELAETYVKITFTEIPELEKSWLNCTDTFTELMKSEKVWDLTYSQKINKAKERTAADTSIKRVQIRNSSAQIDFIKSDLGPLFIPNANGPNLFVYPTFLVLFKGRHEFGIFDLKEIQAQLNFSNFHEEEKVPKDAEIIDHTWKKANKDGSMDKRFKGNYQIPIARYGMLFFKSDQGLEEGYMFSNSQTFAPFADAYNHHVKLLNTV